MRTPMEQILFESDDMKKEDVKDLLSKMKVQKQRWLGTHHPANWVRVEAFRSSGVHIGEDVFISLGMVILDNYDKNVYIGDRCAFGNGVSLVSASAPNDSLLKYHIDVQQCIKTAPIYIEEDCWIGSRAVILPDVRIGKMSVIGAGSVVNRNLEAYNVYAGVPARRIRSLDKAYADVRTAFYDGVEVLQ